MSQNKCDRFYSGLRVQVVLPQFSTFVGTHSCAPLPRLYATKDANRYSILARKLTQKPGFTITGFQQH